MLFEMYRFCRLFIVFMLVFPGALHAQELGPKGEIDAFIGRMVAVHGFDRGRLESLFGEIQRLDDVIRLVSPPASTQPKNWKAYRARFVDPVRIGGGVHYWNEYRDALTRARAKYDVPPEIIVAIIGVETLYGRHTGKFRVVDALATLAFDYPDTSNRDARMSYFQRELENSLVFARQSGIDPRELYGSYAGAIGLPQFMPGSIMKYGVDFDGDGKIDLTHSPVDAIGSIANFLVMHGWKKGEPLVFPVSMVPGKRKWKPFAGSLSAKFSLPTLKAAGISPQGNPPDLNFGLVDLQNGGNPAEYWLGTNNFFAIAQYNRSYYYAMSVVDLSRAVKKAYSFRPSE